jgi:hypothetical protein
MCMCIVTSFYFYLQVFSFIEPEKAYQLKWLSARFTDILESLKWQSF